VFDTEQPQHGGVQVVDINWIFDSGVTEFISRAINKTAFDAATAEPDAEAGVVVVAAVAALAHWCSTKFARPDYQRVFEHIALFQIGNERHACAIDFLRF